MIKAALYLERQRVGNYEKVCEGRSGSGIIGTLKTSQPGSDSNTNTHLYTLCCGFGRQSNVHAFKHIFPLSDSHSLTYASHTGKTGNYVVCT